MFLPDRLKGISVFVVVADSGSFIAAAEKLNLTGSAVSKSVARLESRLGKKLFNRTTRSLSLTEAGYRYYCTCTGILSELEETELSLTLEEREPFGKVRIDLPASYGRMHVLPVIMAFTRQYPLLQPHITFTDRFVDPVQENIDIVVRIGGPDVWHSALGHRYIGAQRLVFCASPACLLRRGVPKSARELDKHDCIGYAIGAGMISPWYFTGSEPGEMERRVIPARIALGDGESELQAALGDYGIAQLPLWLVEQHLENGTLKEVMPELSTDGMPMNIVWLKSRESLPKIRALLSELTDKLTPTGVIR